MSHDRQADTGPARSSSKFLVIAIFAIIIGCIAAFLIVRPNPSGTGNGTTNPAAPASQR